MTRRYPGTAYDRDPYGWAVTSREVSQVQIASELTRNLHDGIPLRGGPLPPQRADGSVGFEDGSVISIVWASAEREDGSRTVLGWYESSR